MGFLKKRKDKADKGSDFSKKAKEKGTNLGTKGVKGTAEYVKKGYEKGKQ